MQKEPVEQILVIQIEGSAGEEPRDVGGIRTKLSDNRVEELWDTWREDNDTDPEAFVAWLIKEKKATAIQACTLVLPDEDAED